jgi:hypothetical protein
LLKYFPKIKIVSSLVGYIDNQARTPPKSITFHYFDPDVLPEYHPTYALRAAVGRPNKNPAARRVF